MLDLATDKQVSYLGRLNEKAFQIGCEVEIIDWEVERSKGMTVRDADQLIHALRDLIFFTNMIRSM